MFKEEIIEKNDRNFVIEGGTPCIEEREKGEREGRPQGGKRSGNRWAAETTSIKVMYEKNDTIV